MRLQIGTLCSNLVTKIGEFTGIFSFQVEKVKSIKVLKLATFGGLGPVYLPGNGKFCNLTHSIPSRQKSSFRLYQFGYTAWIPGRM
jgi:hypothetical protein